jgi:exosortase
VPPLPSHDLIRSRPWQLAVGAVLAALAFAFHGALYELGRLWVTNADYSHGFLVVAFVGYLLWKRRDLFPAAVARWPDPWGVPFFAAAGVVYVLADRFNIAREWLQAFAVMTALAGVVVMFCGRWKGLRWAWPAFVFLPMTFPLPFTVEQTVSLKLREFATAGANFAFQTFGLPSYTEGNLIVIGETRLAVAEACSGLSMLLVFVALSTAVVVLYTSRPLLDRMFVLAAAVPIAVLCNTIRIIATGLIYHAGWKELGDAVVHDLFGWLMMPIALLLMWGVLKLLDWLVEPGDRLSTGDALGLPARKPEPAR